jgi:hypothetical protein
MKNFLAVLTIIVVTISYLFAQAPLIPTIDNKGNRTQTYPNVTKVNSTIQNLTYQVSIANLEKDIRFLQNLGIREAQSPTALVAQNWIIEKFESFGLDVSVHHFISWKYPANGDTLAAGNVVAVKRGTKLPEQYIIISAHYDHPDGPGADDNASGTAGVIECARILSKFPTKCSIIFVVFNAEEYAFHGSVPFAAKCAEENMNILGVFNLDMLGFYPAQYGDAKMFTGGHILTEKLFNYYVQVANLYVPDVPTLPFSDASTGRGDAMAFNYTDYPALYIGDVEYTNLHPCYHKPCDTIGEFGGVNNLNLVRAYTKAAVAATAELANGWLPPQNFSAVSATNKVTLSWDYMPETSKYLVYKNDVFLTETKNNSYIDNNVTVGEKYAYYVIGIQAGNNEKSNPSNIDSIVFSTPLAIPYSLDFESDMSELKYWWCNNWKVIGSTVGKCLFQVTRQFSIIELDWFPIPINTPNISLQIMAQDGFQEYYPRYWFIEATSDRKTWHKLAKSVDFGYRNPDTLTVSLNKFIGSPFFQMRIRIGVNRDYDFGNIYLHGLNIDFKAVGVKEYESTYFKNFQIYPNPSMGVITITTESENSYSLSVYDLNGKRIMHKSTFQDGTLDLSLLSKGVYFVQVERDQHQVVRKVVVQ